MQLSYTLQRRRLFSAMLVSTQVLMNWDKQQVAKGLSQSSRSSRAESGWGYMILWESSTLTSSCLSNCCGITGRSRAVVGSLGLSRLELSDHLKAGKISGYSTVSR